MDNPRPEKVAVVEEVKGKLSEAEAVMVAEYRGLDVGSMAELRRAMREGQGELKIYKNSLVRFAAADLDMEIEDLLSGPTALAFVTSTEEERADPVTVAKAMTTFAKTHPELVIKGGVLDGELIDADAIDRLSKVAPREELLARLAGGMAAPMQKFAALLAALPTNFGYALKALIDQGGGPDAPADAPVEAADEVEDSPAEEPAPIEATDDANEDTPPAEDAPAEAAEDAPAEPAAETPADEAAAEDDAAAEAPAEAAETETSTETETASDAEATDTPTADPQEG